MMFGGIYEKGFRAVHLPDLDKIRVVAGDQNPFVGTRKLPAEDFSGFIHL